MPRLAWDQFTDEEKTAFANEAAAQWEEALNNYVEYYLTEDTQEQRDTLRAQAIAYYAAQGYSQDTLLENLMLEEEYNRLEEQLANGYTPTEDEINAVFNEYGEQYRQQYEGNVPMYEFYTQRYGYESWYVPEGISGAYSAHPAEGGRRSADRLYRCGECLRRG